MQIGAIGLPDGPVVVRRHRRLVRSRILIGPTIRRNVQRFVFNPFFSGDSEMRHRALCVMTVVTSAVVLCGAMFAQATVIWNDENDFSAVNNPNGAWSYGNYAGGTFTAFTTPQTVSNGFAEWHGSASDPHIMQNPTENHRKPFTISHCPQEQLLWDRTPGRPTSVGPHQCGHL